MVYNDVLLVQRRGANNKYDVAMGPALLCFVQFIDAGDEQAAKIFHLIVRINF